MASPARYLAVSGSGEAGVFLVEHGAEAPLFGIVNSTGVY